MVTIQSLLQHFAQAGMVEWIGLRPARRADLISVQEACLSPHKGLVGDRHTAKPHAKRQVTLIQAEHLEAVASLLGKESIAPNLTRRNIVVRGINLLALHDRKFSIGGVLLEGSGYCHPCSRMEENLGMGGYNAMRGHGGITAMVLEEGAIKVGDAVECLVSNG